MSQKSKIQWTDATWNPSTGWTQISQGCQNCYAKRFAERFRGTPRHHYEQGFDLKLWPARLPLPLSWRKPRMVFVNTMSDLFHEKVPAWYIKNVFHVMEEADWHTFQVLTKRAKRLGRIASQLAWPRNVWMGVTVESPKHLQRLDNLRKVPVAVKFVLMEPLLGRMGNIDLSDIDWIIAGGESGPVPDPWHQNGSDRFEIYALNRRLPFSLSSGVVFTRKK